MEDNYFIFHEEENIQSLTYNRFCGGHFLSFSLEYRSITRASLSNLYSFMKMAPFPASA